MNNQQLNREIIQYRVSVWEGILIVIGAIALLSAGIMGLAIKASTNALNPKRAEAIAKSLIDYKIPGGSEGVFGINIGSAKFAWVRSSTNPPDVSLFVGKTPLNKETNQTDNSENQDFDKPATDEVNKDFSVTNSRKENKTFCGNIVPITIEEGQQTFSEQPSPVPAIRYIASTTEDNIERIVILTTNGRNAKEKAATVFNSLRCK